MAETILSVGIDVGSSTTEVVFSELEVENTASAFAVPRISIVSKNVRYRSQVYITPLVSRDHIDAPGLRALVEREYRQAGYVPADVHTGAVIITGETARAENADEVINAISEFAGDFVVATAGPDLESVLAARGAGIDLLSKDDISRIANFDIGGGTTNIAVYNQGRLAGVSCLDIGARLVRIENNRIEAVRPSITRLAAARGIQGIEPGAPADVSKLRALADAMASELASAVGLAPREVWHEELYTNRGNPLDLGLRPDAISFTGGVADLVDRQDQPPVWEYGDLGVLFGRALAESADLKKVTRHVAAETINATVVGAGIHTTEISGSTVALIPELLPLKNVPIADIDDEDFAGLPSAIAEAVNLYIDRLDGPLALAMSTRLLTSFNAVQEFARAVVQGAKPLLDHKIPIIVVFADDRAKVVGQAIQVVSPGVPIMCIDGIYTRAGDYIDIGSPVGGGRAVPVVTKTLVFNESTD